MKKILITTLLTFVAYLNIRLTDAQARDNCQSLSEKQQLNIAIAGKQLINRWQLITFMEFDNKRLLEEIYAADRITEIPASLYEIQQRMKTMGEEAIAALSPEQRDLLKAGTLEEYKRAYKAGLEDKRKSDWAHHLAHPHTYEFRNDSTVFQHFAVEAYESEFSCRWTLKENNELLLFHDPAAAAAGNETLPEKDTIRYVILYLDADSLSLKIKGKPTLEDWEQPRFKTVSALLQK